MVLPQPLAPEPPEGQRLPLEEIRSHLTVVLNDLILARGRIGAADADEVRPLIDEAIAYAERLCDATRRTDRALP